MLFALLLLAASPYRQAFPLPNNVIPNGWGVSLPSGEPTDKEIARLRATGVRWVRQDLLWNEVERVGGRYDFARFDRSMALTGAAGMRVVVVLGSVKSAVDTPQERAGFVRFAEAAVRRYRGRGILWEVWNEPNGPRWSPRPDLLSYTRLAREVGRTIRRVAPEEWYLGPALAGIDLTFLEGCFRSGLLNIWDAVTVHPNRPMEPETVVGDYAKVRALTWKYAKRPVPLLCGEWGYAADANGRDEMDQGDLALRQYLVNIASGVPLTLWYRAKDAAKNAKDPDRAYGILRDNLSDKPAARAMRWLTSNLSGWQFDKRLAGTQPEDWILVFRKFRDVRMVAWTTRERGRFALPRPVMEMPDLGVRFWDTDLTELPADTPWIPISPRPILVWGAVDAATVLRVPTVPALVSVARPQDIADAVRPLFKLRRAVTLEGGGMRITAKTAAEMTAKIPQATWATDRSEGIRTVTAEVAGVRQPLQLISRDPLVLEILPPTKWGLPVRVEGGIVGGTIDGRPAVPTQGVLPYRDGARYRLTAESGGKTVLSAPEFQVLRLDPSRIAASQTLEGPPGVSGGAVGGISVNPAGLPFAYPDGVQIDFEFGQGIQSAVSKGPALPLTLPGRPRTFGFWAHGDGSGAGLTIRYADATGQTFEPAPLPVDWTGWRYVTFSLRGESGRRWGGANVGVVRYPIRLTDSLVIDNTGGRGIKGRVHMVAPFVLIGP